MTNEKLTPVFSFFPTEKDRVDLIVEASDTEDSASFSSLSQQRILWMQTLFSSK
jgi:hypothetical protein